ncbi:MAG TPA: hypothetical protein VL793_03655 [Patescibacteria group bacterium]|nr:hypothetical protein [Patescibacteria group bacterium]
MTDQQTPAKSRRGCLFYGCLSGTVCLLAILLAFLIGLHQVKKMLNFFTDTHPVELPTVQMTAAQIEQLKQRVEAFQDALRSGRPTAPLSLTSDEINAYIQTDANLSRLKGKVYVTIEGDRLKGQVSIPLDDLGLGVFRGRYLNGSGLFVVALRHGELIVSPEELIVKGKPLPSVYMDKARSQNLAQNLGSNPRASVALNHLQDIKITDGKLVLLPKVEQ